MVISAIIAQKMTILTLLEALNFDFEKFHLLKSAKILEILNLSPTKLSKWSFLKPENVQNVKNWTF